MKINKKKVRDMEHYLGITDNEDVKYKKERLRELIYLFDKYGSNSSVEYALKSDIGMYIKCSRIVETYGDVCAFVM